MKKKRYIVGHRFGPRFDPKSSQELEAFVASQPEAKVLRRTSVGRAIVEMTEDQMRDFARKNPSLVIEEDQKLDLFAMPGLPERVPAEGNFSISVTVQDATDGRPVPNVSVYGVGAGVAYKAVTGAQGQATLHTSERLLTRVVASARDTYWSKFIPDVALDGLQSLEIKLKPLLVTGAYDWGHRLMGFRQVDSVWTGNEIKVGLIDSGITDRHEDLHPAGGFNTLDGQDTNAWNIDEKGHGTHCGGIIAAANNNLGIIGGAPRAAVYSLKVFPGGYLSDLVEAVEWCIHNRMDIISMSLGSANPSQVMAAALRDAYDRGIACVAAAGNESTRVAYPAAFPTVIGVGAIGRLGTFPEDSAHQLEITQVRDWRGGLFAGRFTNFGSQVDFCAPGVAVLSSVPTGYAAWDGTSTACPMVSALAALILEAYPWIRTNDAQQVESLRSILAGSAVSLGMPPEIQGRGLPVAPRALASAQYTSRTYSYGWPPRTAA